MAFTHISIPLFDTAVQIEERYNEQQLADLNIAAENLAIEERSLRAHFSRDAMAEAMPPTA